MWNGERLYIDRRLTKFIAAAYGCALLQQRLSSMHRYCWLCVSAVASAATAALLPPIVHSCCLLCICDVDCAQLLLLAVLMATC